MAFAMKELIESPGGPTTKRVISAYKERYFMVFAIAK